MKFKTLLSSLAVLVAISESIAQPPPTAIAADDPLVNKLLASGEATTSLHADLTQEKHFRFMKDPLISTGSFSYQKPGRLRWQVDGEGALTILMNGSSVRVKEKGHEIAVTGIERKMYSAITELVNGIVTGDLLKSQRVKASYFTQGDDLIVLLLPVDPRMTKHFKEVKMNFNRTSLLLDVLRITEADGDLTEWRFTNTQRDVALPISTFTSF